MSRLRSLFLDWIPKPLRNGLSQAKGYHSLWGVIPIQYAAGIVWNRFRFGLTADERRRKDLNEEKHRMMEQALSEQAFRDFHFGFADGPSPQFDPASLPIWVCWLQGEDAMPELNKTCVRSIRRNAGSHPVRFVSEETVADWITVPVSILEAYRSGKIMPAIYCDYIRCSLLYRYGGVWLDSTVILTTPIGEEWFTSAWMSIRMKDADNESVSRGQWASFALGAYPASPFFGKVCGMFVRYFTCFDRNVDYLLIDYFFDLLVRANEQAESMHSGIPYSNPAVHKLRYLLNQPFDPGKFALMLSDTYLFKLTYKTELAVCLDGKETYWGHLLDQYDA